ncbi:DHA2 family efflux MFS transporter permease subunit [Sporomusa sp.]|uniref:DHA2 family efflux MFS transporter permease subunit n=1 Tax=Sporomusa sp. TaxID=2078658 RepID=UPI002C1C2C66|nr:DHA2 family efflux MFS transporter permease subunit [Sporomusa sp.]HWR05315.1 DHA2 family efflux MFS transporter permease subunit [Sporomusa sp.]
MLSRIEGAETEQATSRNKYLVLFTVTIGTLLSAYLSNSVSIALPNIMQVFGFSMDSVVWVSLSYLLPYGSILPVTGKLGDQFGRKRVYLIGLAIFTFATLLVGLAWNSTTLIIFRLLQGIGSGLLFPNAMALVSEAFSSRERGQALGLWGALAASGTALGPTVGGLIVEYLDWRMLFFFAFPVAAAGLLLAANVLTESKTHSETAKIDYIGGTLLVTSLSCLLVVLNQGAKEGWTSLYIMSLSITAILAMVIFIAVEMHIENPIVDLTLFRNITFTASNLVGFLSFMAMNGGIYLLPFYFRNIQGYSAIKAGIAMLPLTVFLIVLAPVGGRLANVYGARVPATLGMLIMTVSLFSFRLLDEGTSYSYIATGLIIMGVGRALTMSPLSNGVMNSLPKDKLGVGSGVFNLCKNFGGSVGVAVMGALLDTRQTLHIGTYQDYINSSSQAATQAVAVLQNSFSHNGFTLEQARSLALYSLQGIVTKQAAIAAYGDVFLVSGILCAIGILPTLFIQTAKSRFLANRNTAGEAVKAARLVSTEENLL